MAQTLYRKYRSQRFAELVGQSAVTRVLRNSITRGRLNHAYLFAGPRGTGKTSVARIFAKALNCLDPLDGDACGKCEACLAVANGTAVDVVEIDAASNRGIDDVRELRERVNYAPLSFKYKVYIVDEAHMITGPAFNALLKTLEEPPGFVIFCLCTTEAHKLPVTILSRCIRFDFQRLPLDALAGHLRYIANQEGLELHEDAALCLAELAEGSARDAISLLDQLTAYCSGEITLALVHELFQLSDTSFAAQVLQLITQGEPAPMLEAWRAMLAQGVDAGKFLLAVAGQAKQEFLATSQQPYRAVLQTLWQGVNMLKLESFPTLLVELTLLEAQAAWSRPVPVPTTAQTQNKAATLHERPSAQRQEQSARTVVTAPEQSHVAASRTAARPVQPDPQRNSPASIKPEGPELPEEPAWVRFLDEVKRQRLTTYTHVFNCAKALATGGVLHITFRADQRISYNAVQKPEHSQLLVSAANIAYGAGIGVEIAVAGQTGSEVRLHGETTAAAAAKADELPPELVGDMIEDDPVQHTPASNDPIALHLAEEELYAGLRSTDHATTDVVDNGNKKPPVTAQEAMNLFEGVELDDEEFGK